MFYCGGVWEWYSIDNLRWFRQVDARGHHATVFCTSRLIKGNIITAGIVLVLVSIICTRNESDIQQQQAMENACWKHLIFMINNVWLSKLMSNML